MNTQLPPSSAPARTAMKLPSFYTVQTIVQSIPRDVLYLNDLQTMGPAPNWRGFVKYISPELLSDRPKLLQTIASIKGAKSRVLLIDACGVTESAAIGQMELALAADCEFRGIICLGAVCGLGVLAQRKHPLGLAAIALSLARWGSEDDTPSRHAMHVEVGTVAFADPDGVVLVPPAALGKLAQLPTPMKLNEELGAFMEERRRGA